MSRKPIASVLDRITEMHESRYESGYDSGELFVGLALENSSEEEMIDAELELLRDRFEKIDPELEGLLGEVYRIFRPYKAGFVHGFHDYLEEEAPELYHGSKAMQ